MPLTMELNLSSSFNLPEDPEQAGDGLLDVGEHDHSVVPGPGGLAAFLQELQEQLHGLPVAHDWHRFVIDPRAPGPSQLKVSLGGLGFGLGHVLWGNDLQELGPVLQPAADLDNGASGGVIPAGLDHVPRGQEVVHGPELVWVSEGHRVQAPLLGLHQVSLPLRGLRPLPSPGAEGS